MKLFSWFIKANNKSKTNAESLAISKTEDLETKLNEKSNAFNNNTMWPIAKVKTTPVIIKEVNDKLSNEQDKRETVSRTKVEKANLVTISLGQD